MPRPDPTDARSRRRGHPLRRLLVLTLAVLAGGVALAPSALAYHPEVEASVACVDEQIVLDWTATSWMGPEFWGPDYYNDDIRVFLQYGTDSSEIGGLTDTQIGSGAFTESSLQFSGSTVLSPPAGATRVRVHSAAFAPWGSGNQSIPDPTQTTGWLTLPTGCTEEPPPPPPPADPEVDAGVAYDCEVSPLATVTVTSTGGASTFVVRVDGVVVATLADVDGTDGVDLDVEGEAPRTITVAVDGVEILSQVVDPTPCAEVGGVVTQPTPPTTPTTTPDPTVGSGTLPRTGVSTSLLVALATALAGAGLALVRVERRAVAVEVDRH